MPISSSSKDGVVLVKLDKDLIGHKTHDFRTFCHELASKGVSKLILNLQEVNSIDSLGTNEIFRIIEKGIDVRLINVSHNVNLFFKCHAPYLMEQVCSNETEALEFIHKKELDPKTSWIERRESRRKYVQFPVVLKRREAAASSEEIEGMILNISGGGLLTSFTQADCPLSPLWEWLSLRLFIPELSAAVSVEGQLTRSVPQSGKWLMGIKFTQIDTIDHNRIIDYVYNKVDII